jgi:hypothetical protein
VLDNILLMALLPLILDHHYIRANIPAASPLINTPLQWGVGAGLSTETVSTVSSSRQEWRDIQSGVAGRTEEGQAGNR